MIQRTRVTELRGVTHLWIVWCGRTYLVCTQSWPQPDRTSLWWIRAETAIQAFSCRISVWPHKFASEKNSEKLINILLDSWWTAFSEELKLDRPTSFKWIENVFWSFSGSPSRPPTSSRETPNSHQYSKSYNHVFRLHWIPLEIYLFIYFSHKCWRHFVKALHKADSDYLRFQFVKKNSESGLSDLFHFKKLIYHR